MRSKFLVKKQHPKAQARRNASGSWCIVDPFMGDGHHIGIGVTASQAWLDAARSLMNIGNSIRAHVDRLIDWHGTAGAKKPIKVAATANTVRKFARKRGWEYHYRGWIIVPSRPVMTRQQRRALQQQQENRHGQAT
jgi:hypothetical protein